MKKLLFVLAALLCTTLCRAQSDADKIREAVRYQIKIYPEMTLQDLYKSFFQDRFGPGHIISDAAAAEGYLRRELEQSSCFPGLPFEKTGFAGNFYRVNLGLIRDEIITANELLSALIRSANEYKPYTPEQWKAEWAIIDSVIAEMNLNLPDYASDRKRLNEYVAGGNYVMHHSERFSKFYDIHYRIIAKDIFMKEFYPRVKDL